MILSSVLNAIITDQSFMVRILWRRLGMVKCPKCSSSLLSLYHREGAGGKSWVKIKEKYCKVCKKTYDSKLGEKYG